MKFEEVLPALRSGKKIRRLLWGKEEYVCKENGALIDEKGLPLELALSLFFDDWEIVKEPESEYDYDFICSHKILCWFWDDDYKTKVLGHLLSINEDFFDDCGGRWLHCRPVRKNEIEFYEDKGDEDS